MTSKLCAAICIVLAVTGCGSKEKEINRIIESPIDYHSHLSPKADMARYTTWNWLSPLEDEQAVDKLQIEKGIREAIESAVELRLKDRDYQRVTTSPDMVINYHVAGKDIDRDYIRQVYDGSYDPKYRKNFDGPGSARDNWEEGSIILFAFDAGSGDLLWRSSATAEVTGEAPLDRRVERLDQAIKMMFTSLPGK
jgi:hypothetical protein